MLVVTAVSYGSCKMAVIGLLCTVAVLVFDAAVVAATSGECCERLEVIGASDMQRLRMGLYIQKPKKLNGRPMYSSEHNETFLYHTNNDWWIGDDVGEARGGLYTESQEICPENIKTLWKKIKGSKWHNSHLKLKCAGNISCCDQVVVSGAEEIHPDKMGVYEYRGEMQSSRRLYKQKGGDLLLYFQIGTKHQQWHIHKNISKHAWLYVNDAPLCPERLTESWKEWITDIGEFYLAPELKVKCVDDLDINNCCDNLHVTGLDPQNPARFQIYTKTTRRTDGRIAYASEAGKNFLFYEDDLWWIGDMMGFAQGEFSVKDEAGCPNNITEVWQQLISNEWVNTTDIKVSCAEPLTCCHRINIWGAEHHYPDSMGVYEFEGQVHNNRWVYRHRDLMNAQYFLHFSKGMYLEAWSIYSSLSHFERILTNPDSSICPENMTSSWEMWIRSEQNYIQQNITVNCVTEDGQQTKVKTKVAVSDRVKNSLKKIIPLKQTGNSISIVIGFTVGAATASLLLILFIRLRRRKRRQRLQMEATVLDSSRVIYKPTCTSDREVRHATEGTSHTNHKCSQGNTGWDYAGSGASKNMFTDVEPLVENEYINVGESRQ